MKRLLLTGASGFLGWQVAGHAQDEWEIVGVACRHPVPLPRGLTSVTTDLTDGAAVRRLFAGVRPDAVLHLAALADPNACQREPERSRAVNVTASVTLAEACAAAGIPCVFASTDLVFDGRHAPYDEAAAAAPRNLYGEHKLLAEKEMRLRCPQLTVCRLPLMYGPPGPAAPGFVATALAAWRAGQPVRLFTDEFRTPALTADVAAGLFLALRERPAVLHLGGPERLSRHAFGLILAQLAGVDPTLVQPCRQADIPMAAPRPADVSLDSRRAFTLGYHPRPASEALRTLLGPPF
ncbi:MAG: NAD(P)-dependent oxidoreductase [Lentisphaeria bacterium]